MVHFCLLTRKEYLEHSITDLCITTKQFRHLRAKLCADVYRNDPAYRDNTTALLKLILNSQSCFARGAEIWPITVINTQGVSLACALLIRSRFQPDTMQVGFLEVVHGSPNPLKLLIKEACSKARHYKCTNVLIGSNGHVNHGLGLLAGPFGYRPSFGSAYNPPHYIQMLAPLAHRTETLVTYCHDVATSPISTNPRWIGRVTGKFNVRQGNFRRMKSEIAIYTQLNNQSFAEHSYYFERTSAEDLELFQAFGPLLREENFLVAEHNGRPVGFLLWYPDFNELVSPGNTAGLATLLRYRLLGQRPMRCKIAELGVLPEFRNSGAILALVAHCYSLVRGKYRIAESGWILEYTRLSIALNTRWHGKADKTYNVFHIDPYGISG